MNMVDMCRREKELTLDFVLNIDKWKTIDPKIKQLVSGQWESIKFMNEDCTGINKDIDKVPNDKGGIYVFLLKPENIPNLHTYIMYIGRVRRKNGFSLQRRCKEYLSDDRVKIAYMRELWGEELYFYYFPLDDDELIERVERELIRVIIPPCNSQIPDQYITYLPATDAF